MTAQIIINETHQLMDDQARVLNEKFGEGSWERFDVPASGWTAVEQLQKLNELGDATIVFASPLPAMLLFAARREGARTHVFHNDTRDKKELPGGKIIMVVAKEGWEII